MSNRLAIPNLADPALLKAVWKRSLRKRLKTTRFKDMELARDPLEYLGLERRLDAVVGEIAQQLLDGTYRPQAPESIRAGKRVGLTRPLAFLAPRDQLVYKALVALAENDLLRGSPAWTRLGRTDTANEEDDSVTLAESGWFRSWLRRDGQLWVIDENYDWLVESDVSNFFPSIQVTDVCAFVQDNSRLGIGLIRLLEYMLQIFSPMAAYRPSRVGGLPQEGFDVSRVLAHLYLRPLDDEFSFEGESNRFSRWVDDIVVGADSWDEALRIVQRIQTSLEGVGLYANSSKTRIIRSQVFRSEYMKSENDWLGEFETEQESGAGDLPEFRRRLRRHVTRPERPKGWPRVLRRFYTNCRRLRDPYLIDRWPGHLEASPDSIRSIIDYLATFALTPQRFNRLQESLDRLGGVYEDVEILAHEYLCVAPSADTRRITEPIADWALAIVQREFDRRPRIASAACVTVGKFGSSDHLDALLRIYSQLRRDNAMRTQSAIILLATGRIGTQELSRLVSRSRLETIETLEFLLALIEKERQTIGMTLSAMEPVHKHDPDRYVTKARLIFLAPLIREAAPKQYSTMARKWEGRLRSNPPSLRDHVSERWLFR
jgi:Reverse transcriptase (RNA-dependent DNA polymerase)